MIRRLAIIALLAAMIVACATSPTGRRQLQLFPEARMQAMGATAFQEMKKAQDVLDDPEATRYVRCVTDAVTAVLPQRYRQEEGWEVVVFADESANAFALPGGRIGIHAGMLETAQTPDQLAAVIGHEIAHVMADHSNERMSQRFAVSTSLTVASAMAGARNERQRQAMALLGVGAQVGVLLPFSRLHESEADAIGVELMARAGFDPKASVQLWQNMSERAEGKSPPEFLSTHPSHGTRIDELQDAMPRAMDIYRNARADGRAPQCERVVP